MSEDSGHKNLRDYLGLLRRRRKIIVAIVLSGAGLTLAASFAQDNVYESEASIRVRDPAESLNLVGLLPGQGELPAQTAAQAAATATRVDVIRRAKKKLALSESIGSIQDRVTATQDPRSNLILLEAGAPTAKQAADLANAVAETAAEQANRDARAEFAQTAKRVIDEAESISVPESAGDDDTDARRRDLLTEQAARLEGLGTVTKLAEVVTRATAPDGPASPKPMQNALLGAFIGLFVSLAAVGVLEALDRRLRNPDQAHDLLGWPILGLIPESAIGGVPVADSPAPSHVAAMDAFRMLKTNLGYLNVDDPPQTVLVASAAPEEGKSTVATGLAFASAASGRRTLLLEVDLHRPTLAQRLGLEPEPGLADYLIKGVTPAEVLRICEFRDPATATSSNGSGAVRMRLDCVTAGTRPPFAGEVLGSARFGEMLAELREVYDLVVIDSAPLLAVAETLEIVPQVDAVLYCVRLSATTLDDARAGREALERLPGRPTGIVVNGLGADGAYSGSYYSYAYSYRFGHSEAETARSGD